MTAWRPLVAASSSPPPGRSCELRATTFRLGPELAVVLTEMALRWQRRSVKLVQRRYLRVDPDNRLVADSLEADLEPCSY